MRLPQRTAWVWNLIEGQDLGWETSRAENLTGVVCSGSWVSSRGVARHGGAERRKLQAPSGQLVWNN